MTNAEAGFPGNAKIVFVCEDNEGIVAKVVGLPGFIATRPKCIVPFKDRSIVGFNKSNSPIETPPVVIITSTFCKASFNSVSNDPGLQN